MGSVQDRLGKLERSLIEIRRDLQQLQGLRMGVVPEWADLKTLSKMFGAYSVTTLRYRIKRGKIPASLVRREGKKLLVNVIGYRKLVVDGGK